MAAPSVPLPDPDSWEPLHLQLVAFPTVPASAIAQDWWQELVHEPPQESLRKRQERTDQGVVDGRKLTSVVDLLRVAWAVQANIDPENIPEDPIPSLGPFGPVRNWFTGLMTRWLSANPPEIKRLAFAGKLIQRTEGHVSGYSLLDRYLPDVYVDPASTDFFYRVNRKRPSRSAVPGLEINRLCTWTVGKFTATVSMGIMGVPTSRTEATAQERFACSLDFDINTVHEFEGVLPRESLSEIFLELADLATEIAANGDIR